jgi:TRAP transporter TAXI family solute receptor
MDASKKKSGFPMVTALVETFGFSPAWALVVALGISTLCLLALAWVVHSAPPRTLTITSGPEGSTFARYADGYQKSLASHGVTLVVLPSQGSSENLRRLQSAKSGVDVGFVQGGLAKDTPLDGLMSLGSVAYQPLFVFYRSAAPISRLAELAGKHIAVGAPGSGTRTLALALLEANGITGEPTKFDDLDAQAAAAGLLEGKIDAVFLMGDSAPIQILRNLVHSPEVQMFNFAQADAYVRRFPYLNRMVLPEGSIDIGKDLPAKDVVLVGPTVELVARDDLNPALADQLLEAVKEIHGKAGMLQKRGEFPAPIEHEFPISDDARVWYKSGLGLFYRLFHSFWLASIFNRVLVALVPLALVIIPGIRMLPVLYRWNIQLRIYRCYRPLLRLERESFGPLTRKQVDDLLRQLGEIEADVNRLKVPASFASQFYELRGHLAFVRQRLMAATPA